MIDTLDYYRHSVHLQLITMTRKSTDQQSSAALVAAGLRVSGLNTKKRYLR